MNVWIQAFIVIAAVAIVIQMVILLAMLLSMKGAIEKFTKIADDLTARIDPILLRTNRILEDSEDKIASIMADGAEVTRLARGQAQKIDRVFTDSLERVRVQVIRADQILAGALEVIEDTGTKVRNTLWGPVHQVSAVLKGVKVGIDVLRGVQRRAEPDGAPQDEELFI
jgi:methyl-accepting chemotaxis protein